VPVNSVLTIKAYAGAAGFANSPIQSSAYNTTTPAYASIVMATTPTAFWPLNEVAGPTAFNVSGSGPNGTYSSSGVTYGDPGPAGNQIVTVDGSSGKVTIPYSTTLNPNGPFTVEAWLNPAAVSASLLCAVSSVNVTSPRQGWLIYESTAGWEFRTYNTNTTAFAVDIAGGTPTVSQWDHVAAVWDGSKGYLYVNGVLKNTSVATNYVANGSTPFTIGTRSDSAFTWSGSVGDVAFYSRALAPREIVSHALSLPILNIGQAGGKAVITWGGGTLVASPTVNGTYTPVPSVTSPWTNTPVGNQFYRAKQ
jgi:hypothetical protein